MKLRIRCVPRWRQSWTLANETQITVAQTSSGRLRQDHTVLSTAEHDYDDQMVTEGLQKVSQNTAYFSLRETTNYIGSPKRIERLVLHRTARVSLCVPAASVAIFAVSAAFW